MKLNFELDKLQPYFDTLSFNVYFSDLMKNYFENQYEENIKNIDDNILPYEYMDIILDYLNVDDKEVKLITNYFDVETFIKKVDPDSFKDNMYLKNISVNNKSIDKMKLINSKYLKHELINLDQPKIDESKYFLEVPQFAFLTKDYSYLELVYKETTWMSITPYEINTMKDCIQNAKGNTLVIGLGLGYFPYMLNENDNVKSITVVENDPSVIKLFNDNIKIKRNKQFRIVSSDCFKNIDKLIANNKIDYVFFDIYHNEIDGLFPYIKMLNISKKYPNVKFEYWIERSILAIVRRMYIVYFYEHLVLDRNFSMKDSNINFNKEKCDFEELTDIVISNLYKYFENKQIKNLDELNNLLTDKEIIKFIQTIK